VLLERTIAHFSDHCGIELRHFLEKSDVVSDDAQF